MPLLRKTPRRSMFNWLLALVSLAALAVPSMAQAAPPPWNTGDVFVGIAGGAYQVYTNAGVFKETLQTGTGYTTGCGVDAPGNFFGTNFSNSIIPKYDATTHVPAPFGSGYSTPEDVAFDNAGHVFVGNLGAGIREFDANGTFIKSIIPSTRVDWFDIAADQNTILYTDEGGTIHRASIATGLQLTDFAASGGNYALRILTDGSVLVASGANINKFNAAGVLVQTFSPPGGTWFALNLDPNGTSFWSAPAGLQTFQRFNIATGASEAGPFNTGTGTVYGICLKGEITAATQGLTLTPASATNPTGTPHTVTATATSNGQPAPGITVTFAVTGVNPTTGACVTAANGQCTFTYTGMNVGNDTITATATIAGTVKTAIATKTWTQGAKTPHSLALNGVDGYAEAANTADLNITGNWTVESWFRDEDPAGFNHAFRQIVNKGDSNVNPESPYFIVVGNNHLLAGVRTGGTNYPIDVNLAVLGLDPTKWHHVAVTFRADLNVLNLWLDGNHISFKQVPAHSVGNTLPVEIGRNGANSDKYWLGKLDDMRIWNIARTGADITATFMTEFTGTPPANLVANWQFDESSGTTAADFADSHIATLHGGATFSTDVHP